MTSLPKGLSIDDQPLPTLHVDEITIYNTRNLTGPFGIKPGMTLKAAERKGGSGWHRRLNSESGTYDYYRVGKHHYVTWIRLGYFDGSKLYPKRLESVSLVTNRKVAFRAMEIEGC